MKKKLIALTIIGAMAVGSCISAVAGENSTSVSGITAKFNAKGTITVNNVENTAVATATSSIPSMIETIATIHYKVPNGEEKTSSLPSAGSGVKRWTTTNQKIGVQVTGASGTFTVVSGATWSDSCYIKAN